MRVALSSMGRWVLLGLCALVWSMMGTGCIILDGSFGGDVVDECGPFERCDIGCVGGDCTLVCAEGSRCDASCVGGDCEMFCEQDATCNFSCTGGDCHIFCHATANCDMSCVGGDCILEHFGSIDDPSKRPPKAEVSGR